MPVYLCRPGHASSEPWRHGVQVYAYPFRIDGTAAGTTGTAGTIGDEGSSTTAAVAESSGRVADGSGRIAPASEALGDDRPSEAAAAAAAAAAAVALASGVSAGAQQGTAANRGNRRRTAANDSTTALLPLDEDATPAIVTDRAASAGVGVAVRRVRHAEVVLADEVSAAYGRYWLRLRWPGPRGGVAGYIALGVVPPDGPVGGDELFSGAGGGASPDTNTAGQQELVAAVAASGAVSGEREFRYRTQMSEVSDYPVGAPSRNNSMTDVPQQQTADAPDITPGYGGVAGSSEPNSGAATPTSAVASSPIAASKSDEGYSQPPKCEKTGLYFPSSAAMELLASYDDGLFPPSRRRADSGDSEGDQPNHLGEQIGGIFHPHPPRDDGSIVGGSSDAINGGEPVFCRICREGLHDVNYDLDAAAGDNGGGSRQRSNDFQAGIVVPPPQPQRQARTAAGDNATAIAGHDHRPDPPGQLATQQAQQPIEPPSAEVAAAAAAATKASAIVAHHPSAENPLLAPCLCTGSMAFVHYLCVEQWRCRSRHPAAKNGLNCETCGGAYTLPPPPTRPISGSDEADWLEAMPAHVLAALRRPHPWWQIGTAIVRRRWLRPLAPIIMSPIVALYCRARRMLKKRGVSRRRWACSLCRRRARWKCVRCLRSYYCSRQCQNVSWHIVHKHLCYKPVRFWWSLVVYGGATVLAFPGVLRDPVVYDLGLSCLLGSFVVMGIIGGSIATSLKRGVGIDIRGRSLELTVVVLTLWMTCVAWGLVWGFFGESSRCWGSFSGIADLLSNSDGNEEVVGADDGELEPVPLPRNGPVTDDTVALLWLRLVFRPSKLAIGSLDKIVARSGPFVGRFLCRAGDDDGNGGASACLPMARKANPEFFLPENGGEKCVADIYTVTAVLMLAGGAMTLSSFMKRRERERRNAGAPARAGGRAVPRAGPRPHQD